MPTVQTEGRRQVSERVIVARVRLFPHTAAISADGHLMVGGVDTCALAKYWGTPLYLYDEQTIQTQCRTYLDALERHCRGPFRVSYAAKAFLSTAIARLIAHEGLGLDVVSDGELFVALAAGFPPHMSSNYNQARRPAVLLVRGGRACMIVRRVSVLDLVRRDVLRSRYECLEDEGTSEQLP
jgi:diaminopimelate decarboxylase